MFKLIKISPLLFLLFFGVAVDAQTTKTKAASGPGGGDKELNLAMEKARATFKEFEVAFLRKKKSYRNFAIKKKFNTITGGEHIWVRGITKQGDDYYGIVNNIPNSTMDIKPGDKIKIDKKTLSDWMFIDGKTLHGGYTIKVLRHRMTKIDKEEFDEEYGWVIKD